jgi:hypothetical protein
MAGQHTENLLRRFKGELVSITCVSTTKYRGRISEITNDYVALTQEEKGENSQVFVLFDAIESVSAEGPGTD